MLTTSMGLLRAEMSVNPTMSLKKIVTQSNCSALTSRSEYLNLNHLSLSSSFSSNWVVDIQLRNFRPWPRGSSWAVRPLPSATSDKVTCRRVFSHYSTPSTWLEASERVSPSCRAYLPVSWRTRDLTPGKPTWRLPVSRCRLSYSEFPKPRRHSNPEHEQFRRIHNNNAVL